MPRNTTRQSPEARKAKLDAAHDTLVAAVESLTTSEDWRRWLATMSRFHRYSASNCLMILTQRPDATAVAGFRTWKSLGRSVRKGTKGIAIWAPMTRRIETDDDEPDESTTAVRRVGFKLAYVFDVSDTDGEPLPEHPDQPRLLSGEAPPAMVEALTRQIHDAGYSLRYEPAVPDYPGANGSTDFFSHTVTIATDGRSPAARAKTLAHELAHVLLHADLSHTRPDRSRREVEAESVAYLVCAAYGLDAIDYTLGYVAGWSGGDPAVVLATANTVQSCANTILDRADNLSTPAHEPSAAEAPQATRPALVPVGGS